MTEPTTIRERLRAQVILFNNNDLPAHERAYQMAEHAVAALALLDNAHAEYLADVSGAQGLLGQPHTRYRFVPDPAPRPKRKRPEMTDAQREDVLLQLEHLRDRPRGDTHD